MREVEINGVYLEVSTSGRIWRASGQEATATNNGLGYYRTRIGGKKIMIHRIVWEAYNGPIPDGMQIDHIDFNKANNSLENLRLVTRSQNASYYHAMLRRKGLVVKRGGPAVGIDNARAIRQENEQGATRRQLAAKYKITYGAVCHILSRRNYKHAA